MIKNIIFDVGNVLFDYCWTKPLVEYGLTEQRAKEIDRLVLKDDIWQEYDNGFIGHEEAKKQYTEKYPEIAEYTHYFFDNMHWINIPRPDVWEVIPHLKDKGYGIYILSNYPEDLFKAHTKGASFIDQLDGGVVSYQAHVGKPDERIYKFLLEKYDLKAEECIFYDDKQENVEAALKLGIKSIVITSEKQLLEEMDKL